MMLFPALGTPLIGPNSPVPHTHRHALNATHTPPPRCFMQVRFGAPGPDAVRFRTVDGSFNNLQFPYLGQGGRGYSM